VTTFSGGTEATAFNPRAVAAIERAGFAVSKSEGDNPRYTVSFSQTASDLTCFSKCFDDDANPNESFGAVMTCTDADKNCPVIIGATRISLPYRDPKEADDTPAESSRYDERSTQIGSEMFYVFSEVAKRLAG
jgi:arsenate reductase